MSKQDRFKKQIEITVPTLDNVGTILKLSVELSTYLNAIRGKLVMEFDPSGKDPIIEIHSKATGDCLCSGTEFKKLGGYRRFMADQLKLKEKKSTSRKKLTYVSNLRGLYESYSNETCATKIAQKNHQKLLQMKTDVENVALNLQKIKNLPEDDWSKYLAKRGRIVESVLIELSIKCCGEDELSNEEKFTRLYVEGVPRWVYLKFIRKDWIKDQVANAKQLLFPKGNFLKGITASFEELLDPQFVSRNKLVFKGSKFLISLLKTDYIKKHYDCLDSEPSIQEALQTEKGRFNWNLLDTSAKDLFAPRLQGKNPPPTNHERIDLSGKISNQIAHRKNLYRANLTAMNEQLSYIQHGIIITNSPIKFWDKIGYNTSQWMPAPEKTIYNWIEQDDPDFTLVQELMVPTDKKTISVIMETLRVKCNWLMDGPEFTAMVNSFNVPFKDIVDGKIRADAATLKLSDVADTAIVAESAKEAARAFLGLSSEVKKKPKRRGGTAFSLRENTKTLINNCDNLKGMRSEILDWIRTSFVADEVCFLAANLIVGSFERDEDLLYEEESEDEDEES